MRENHDVPDHPLPDGAVAAVHPDRRHRGRRVRQLAQSVCCSPGPPVPRGPPVPPGSRPATGRRVTQLPHSSVTPSVTLDACQDPADADWRGLSSHPPRRCLLLVKLIAATGVQPPPLRTGPRRRSRYLCWPDSTSCLRWLWTVTAVTTMPSSPFGSRPAIVSAEYNVSPEVLTPLGWTSTQVIWELPMEQLEDYRCRYTPACCEAVSIAPSVISSSLAECPSKKSTVKKKRIQPSPRRPSVLREARPTWRRRRTF